MGQDGGPGRVLAEDQLQSGGGAVHPAGCVEPGRDAKANVVRRHRPAGQPHFLQQGSQAGALGVLQPLQPRLDDGAVFPCQGHDVRHRADGGQIAAKFQQLLGHTVLEGRA